MSRKLNVCSGNNLLEISDNQRRNQSDMNCIFTVARAKPICPQHMWNSLFPAGQPNPTTAVSAGDLSWAKPWGPGLLQKNPDFTTAAWLWASAAPSPLSDTSVYVEATWKTLSSSIESFSGLCVSSGGAILLQDNRICQVYSRCWLCLQMSERCAASDGQ